MPCVSISRNQYREIAAAIEAGHTEATLKVDNVMQPGEGTAYNVIGKIRGRSSEQQILVAGHYDVYFNGFQDDSCAIGLILAMAQGMLRSGYVPENDIIFVAHAAEEWGKIGTQFDWTTGAWEMINHARPEWAGKTIAMFNFELPALYDGEEQFAVQCEPEFAHIVKDFVENSGLLKPPVNGIYPKGYNSVSVDSFCLEDGVSDRASGVPFPRSGIKDMPSMPTQQHQWLMKSDDRSTYNADVMMTNLNAYGAMVMYVDHKPALEMDLTATCDDIAEAFDAGIAKAAGVDTAEWEAAIAKMRAEVENLNMQIADINSRYEAALADTAAGSELQARSMRSEPKAARSAERRSKIQIHTGSLRRDNPDFEIVIKHEAYQRNIALLEQITDALENGKMSGDEKDPGALDLAWQINGGAEFTYYSFSPEACRAADSTLFEETNPGRLFWGTGKGFTFADTSEAIVSLLAKAAAAESAGADGAGKGAASAAGAEKGAAAFADEIAIYRRAIAAQQELLKA